jgi:hypothetical protein
MMEARERFLEDKNSEKPRRPMKIETTPGVSTRWHPGHTEAGLVKLGSNSACYHYAREAGPLSASHFPTSLLEHNGARYQGTTVSVRSLPSPPE